MHPRNHACPPSRRPLPSYVDGWSGATLAMADVLPEGAFVHQVVVARKGGDPGNDGSIIKGSGRTAVTLDGDKFPFGAAL